ncbi:MAG: hypothetical protein RMJ56_01500 [Gemmataceae bacterium]|nr:zinc-ribbon domain-containing protein [Gemmata sp.]MDW8196257.1 hypothetical protein [Gemmataceae bacterium]
MSIPIVCSGCQAKLNAPDTAAGKKVKCPKCGTVVPVAAFVGFEVVEEEPPPPAVAPATATPAVRAAAKPVVVSLDDDDDEPPSRPKARARQRAADDDFDDDVKPKRKKKTADQAGGVSLARHIIGAVVLVILLGVAGYIFYDKFGKKDDAETTPASSNTNPSPPRPNPPSPPGGNFPQPGPVMPPVMPGPR